MFADHPEIGVPFPKELRYFARMFLGTELDNYRAVSSLLRDSDAVPTTRAFLKRLATELRVIYGTDQAYLRVFGALKGRAVGEISPQYCLLPEQGVRRMHALAPEARILFLIRDPVDRAISGARMKEGEKGDDATRAGIRNRALHPFQLSMSCYSDPLDLYESVFGADRIFVGFMEDIATRPFELLQDICQFLGVDCQPDYFTRLKQVSNKGNGLAVDEDLAPDIFLALEGEYDRLAVRFPDRVNAWRARHADHVARRRDELAKAAAMREADLPEIAPQTLPNQRRYPWSR